MLFRSPEGRIEVRYEGGGSGAFAPFEALELVGRSGRRTERDLAPVDGILAIVRDFADAIRDGRPPIAPGEQALHVLEATLAVYLAAATGTLVELPLPTDHPVWREGVTGLAALDLPRWSAVARGGMYGIGTSKE